MWVLRPDETGCPAVVEFVFRSGDDFPDPIQRDIRQM
jgi:hypothetical protein